MTVPARRAPDLAPRPDRRHLRAVPSGPHRKAARRTLGRVPFFLLSIVVVTVMVLGLAGAQALLSEGAFRVSELSRRARALRVETDLLRMRVARLSSPDRVAAAATRRGMVIATRREILPTEGSG